MTKQPEKKNPAKYCRGSLSLSELTEVTNLARDMVLVSVPKWRKGGSGGGEGKGERSNEDPAQDPAIWGHEKRASTHYHVVNDKVWCKKHKETTGRCLKLCEMEMILTQGY